MLLAVILAVFSLLISVMCEDIAACQFSECPAPIPWIATLMGYTLPWSCFLVGLVGASWWLVAWIPIQRHITLTLYKHYIDTHIPRTPTLPFNMISVSVLEVPMVLVFLITMWCMNIPNL